MENNIERIKKYIEYHKSLDLDLRIPVSLIDIDWLIEQAERAQEFADENIEIRKGYQERSKRTQELEKVLKFYADDQIYTDKQHTSSGTLVGTGYLNILSDNGKVAREALEGSE